MEEFKKIHFIGIGGIGVSAIAKYFNIKGKKISGSDLVNSDIIENLQKEGINVFIGKKKNISKDIDLVIYSPAVKDDNMELIDARKKGIKTMSYPKALGELTKKYFTIAVSGTHGKSTTTSMIANALIKAKFDPTVIVGTKLKEFKNSNCRVGKSKYLIIEADEHMASFLNYYPKIIILTNIEADHLDYYKNLKNILNTFKKYIKHLPKDGVLIFNNDDKNIKNIIKSFNVIPFKTKEFSIKQKEAKGVKEALTVPGEHNILNGLAVLTLTKLLKIDDNIVLKSLSKFRGTWRRFDQKNTELNGKNFILINDYAHHPTEIEATLKSVREKYPKKKIWCIFQPHQYQRTFYLFKDFVNVFKKSLDNDLLNKLYITDIYDVVGREEKEIKEKINTKILIEKISNNSASYIKKEKIIENLKENLESGEVVILMGAGDIYDINKKIK